MLGKTFLLGAGKCKGVTLDHPEMEKQEKRKKEKEKQEDKELDGVGTFYNNDSGKLDVQD